MSTTVIDRASDWSELQAGLQPDEVLVAGSGVAPWGQVLLTAAHALPADVGAALQGRDSGPDPHEVVLMALGACTAITMRMYAARKGWPVEDVKVHLSYATQANDPSKRDDRRILRKIALTGPLDEEQRTRLLAIAEKCPIHQLLTAGVKIDSALTEA